MLTNPLRYGSRVAVASALALVILGGAASDAFAGRLGFGSISGDGDRYVLYRAGMVDQPGAPITERLIDERTGQARTLTPPPGCGLQTVRSAQLLWVCFGNPPPPPQITDLRSGLTRAVAGWDKVLAADAFSISPVDVGTSWLSVRQSGNHYNFLGYLDWHSGAWLWQPPDSATAQPNLDRAALMGPLCSPFRLPVNPYQADDNGPRFSPIAYVEPFRARSSKRGVYLNHCGKGPNRLLDKRCRTNCTYALGRRGRIAWTSGTGTRRTVRYFRPGHRKATLGTLTSFARSDRPVITFSRTRLLVSGGTPSSAYSFKLPIEPLTERTNWP